MFEVMYRIIEDEESLKKLSQNDLDSEDLEGFFALNFNGITEGYYHNNELKDGEEGWDFPSDWFDKLLDALKALERYSYVAFYVPEANNVWIEFRVENDKLVVSKISEKNPPLSGSVFVTKPFEDIEYLDWRNLIIKKEEFKSEVLGKVQMYLNDLILINVEFKKTKQFNNLFNKLKNLTDI